jgi:hypothetical protein
MAIAIPPVMGMFPVCIFLADGLSSKFNKFAKGNDIYKSKNIIIKNIK